VKLTGDGEGRGAVVCGAGRGEVRVAARVALGRRRRGGFFLPLRFDIFSI
jgi:hypothetical protein